VKVKDFFLINRT